MNVNTLFLLILFLALTPTVLAFSESGAYERPFYFYAFLFDTKH
jgi:hypothetical protein